MSATGSNAVLLDTCALIYLANGDEMVPAAIAAIDGATDGVLVSPVSAWEIGLLSRPGRALSLRLMPDAKTWFARVMDAPGIRAAALTAEIAIDSAYLPEPFHADPADRLLVATARHLGVPIVTRDRQIAAYAAAGHVGVVGC